MPIYEYICRSCGERFDRMRPMSERLMPPACASCGGEHTSLALSVPGRVGAAAGDAPAGPCGMEASACCGGGRCLQ